MRLAWWGMSFSVPLGGNRGWLHFGWKFIKDRTSFGNERRTEVGIAFYWRRNRKGQRGKPHVLRLAVLVA